MAQRVVKFLFYCLPISYLHQREPFNSEFTAKIAKFVTLRQDSNILLFKGRGLIYNSTNYVENQVD